MRRALSILLALVFGMGPLLSALPGSAEARLPACCRRHGAHHCAMAAQMAATAAADGTTALTAPSTCPSYPGAILALLTPAYALAAEAQALPQPAPSARVLLPDDAAHVHGPSQPYAGRGPPVSFPS